MDVVVQMPSGVRIRFATSSTRIEIDVKLTLLQQLPRDLRPAVFDLIVDGTLARQALTTVGNVFVLGPGGAGDISFRPGDATTIVFEGLDSEPKVIDIWLPQATVVELRGIRVEDNADVSPAPASTLPRWVHYGSSISHCMEAESPTGTWPAIAAREAGVELLSLGLAGQCMLDQFVARTIRDLPADVISLKVGINVVNGDTLRDRTFGPALHGFIDTIREGHPETPILLVSPIYCPSAEDRPGPTIVGPNGRFITVAGLNELRLTCLTLTRIREMIRSIVELRQGLGDVHLQYLDGLELFGADDAGDLPDDLHPTASGYARMGHRFAELAFGTGGHLARRT
jgi:lysophospholipase L1-like esterase